MTRESTNLPMSLPEQTLYDDEKQELITLDKRETPDLDITGWDLDRSSPLQTLKNLIRRISTPKSSVDLTIAKAVVLRIEPAVTKDLIDLVGETSSNTPYQMARIMVISDTRHFWLPKAKNSEDPVIGLYPLVKYVYGNGQSSLKEGDIVEVQFNNPKAQFSTNLDTGNIINVVGKTFEPFETKKIEEQCTVNCPSFIIEPQPDPGPPPGFFIPEEQFERTPPAPPTPPSSGPPPGFFIPEEQFERIPPAPPTPVQLPRTNKEQVEKPVVEPCSSRSNVKKEQPISSKPNKKPANAGSVEVIPYNPYGKYSRITRGFSSIPVKHPVTGKYQSHWGTDFAVPMGKPYHAALDGEIVYKTQRARKDDPTRGIKKGDVAGFGHYMMIRHTKYSENPDTEPEVFYTVYAHATPQKLFKNGAPVKRGQIIGYSGNSGTSSGPHLHFEYGKAKNQTRWFRVNKHKGKPRVQKDPQKFFIGKPFYEKKRDNS